MGDTFPYTRSVRVDKEEDQWWKAAAKKRGGPRQRNAVARDLLGMLAPEVLATLADLHAYLLLASKSGERAVAGVLAERLEGVMRRIDPSAAALWAEQRQRAQTGGAA